jgi:hypothetical protein
VKLYPQTLGLLLGWLSGSVVAATAGLLPALGVWAIAAVVALIAAR